MSSTSPEISAINIGQWGETKIIQKDERRELRSAAEVTISIADPAALAGGFTATASLATPWSEAMAELEVACETDGERDLSGVLSPSETTVGRRPFRPLGEGGRCVGRHDEREASCEGTGAHNRAHR